MLETETKVKVEVKKCFYPECRAYCNPSFEGLEKNIFYGKGVFLREVKSLGRRIEELLYPISGIKEISLVNIPGGIVIEKGFAYDWEDIEPLVMHVLTTLIEDPGAELFIENKDLTLKCRVTTYANKEWKEYHFNRVICISRYWNSSSSSFEELDSPIREIVEQICDLPMTYSVTLDLYSILICKKPEYDWDTLEKNLKPIFNRMFNSGIEMETTEKALSSFFFGSRSENYG